MVARVSKAEVFGYAWRPLRCRVQLTAPPDSGNGRDGGRSFNDVRVTRRPVGRAWQTSSSSRIRRRQPDVRLQFFSNVYGDRALGSESAV